MHLICFCFHVLACSSFYNSHARVFPRLTHSRVVLIDSRCARALSVDCCSYRQHATHTLCENSDWKFTCNPL
jgi:hypothetical protein